MMPAILFVLALLTSRDYFHPTADWQKAKLCVVFPIRSSLAIMLGSFQLRIYASAETPSKRGRSGHWSHNKRLRTFTQWPVGALRVSDRIR